MEVNTLSDAWGAQGTLHHTVDLPRTAVDVEVPGGGGGGTLGVISSSANLIFHAQSSQNNGTD